MISFNFPVCKLIHTLGGMVWVCVCHRTVASAPSCNTPLSCRKVRNTLFSASTAACQFPAPYAVFLSAPQAVVDSALPPAAATTMVHPHCDVETFEERLSQPPHNEPQVQYGKLRVGCVLLL